MKKYFLILLITFSVLNLVPLSVYATSGACSYHSGVNCSKVSYSGNVTCNDGWVNSSVLFSDADECKITDMCPGIVYGSCTNESDYARVQQQVDAMRNSQSAMNARAGLLGSSMDTSASIGQDQLDSCRRDINLYNAEVQSRNSCIQNQDKVLNQQAQDQILQDRFKLDAFCVQNNGAGSTWIWNGNFPYSDISAIVATQCTPSIDQRFQKNFKIAMDTLPSQYQSVVDSDTIKTLSLDPANASKTFPQIIIERYPNAMKSTSTLTTLPSIVPSTIPSSTNNAGAPFVPIAPVKVFTVNENLRVGASGNDVISLQKFLENKNFLLLPIGITEGYFGLLTKQALVAFQKSVGLPSTGFCGPMTRLVINNSK